MVHDGLGRIERLHLPAESGIEIDRIAVGLEVELLDVVDVGAEPRPCPGFRSLCGSDRLNNFVQARLGCRLAQGRGRRSKTSERGGRQASHDRTRRKSRRQNWKFLF